jgi:sialic acid synthase SpsE
MTLQVKNRRIGYGEPIFLTAEVGCSHLGDVEKAKMLIRAAAEGGCDGVDMFLWDPKANVWDQTLGEGSIVQELQDLALTPAEWEQLHRLADELGIVFYHTPCDPPSVDLALSLGTPMININSDDIQSPIMLEKIGASGLPVTFHDINASLGEVEAAVTRLQEAGAQGPIILHSTLESGDTDLAYASANLRVMDTYKAAFGARGALVGCVEHTTSQHLIFAVAAREPVLISKHLNINYDPETPDAPIAVDIAGLKDMVRKVRLVEQALGEGANSIVADGEGKVPAGSFSRRKMVVANVDIPKGTVIAQEHLAIKRMCVFGGLHPWMIHYLIGAKAKQDIAENTMLTLDMFGEYPKVDWRPQEIKLARYGDAKTFV